MIKLVTGLRLNIKTAAKFNTQFSLAFCIHNLPLSSLRPFIWCTHSVLHCPLLCHRLTPRSPRSSYSCPPVNAIWVTQAHLTHGQVQRLERGSERILSLLVEAPAGWDTHRCWLKGCCSEVWLRILSALVKVLQLDMHKHTHTHTGPRRIHTRQRTASCR